MTRLFAARVTASYDSKDATAIENMQIADRALLFWDQKQPDQAAAWNSTVRLGEEFFKEITERPVPIDMHVLKHLTRSPLALDLYMWSSYRRSYAKGPIAVTWQQLHEQFGADYAEIRNFRSSVLDALRTIKLAWPELEYTTPRGRLVLKPGVPHVKRVKQ
jgi:hypothetical protein